MVTFDLSINLGQIMSAAVFLGGAFMVFGGMRERLTAVSNRLKTVEDEMRVQTSILVDLASVTTRLNEQDKRLSRIEREGDLLREAQALRQVVQVRESAERVAER